MLIVFACDRRLKRLGFHVIRKPGLIVRIQFLWFAITLLGVDEGAWWSALMTLEKQVAHTQALEAENARLRNAAAPSK